MIAVWNVDQAVAACGSADDAEAEPSPTADAMNADPESEPRGRRRRLRLGDRARASGPSTLLKNGVETFRRKRV
jgi:hypothetical protein